MHTHRSYFRERRGCIRLAMRLGVPVVPCFAFGSYESFTIVGGATMNRCACEIQLMTAAVCQGWMGDVAILFYFSIVGEWLVFVHLFLFVMFDLTPIT
jgi:hypothetical protein